MSDKEAESQENASGPGNGMAKMVEESLGKMSTNIKTLVSAILTIRTDMKELKRKAPSAETDSAQVSNQKKMRSDGETPGSSKQNDSDRTSPLSTLFNSGSATDSSQSNKEAAHTISDDDDKGDIDDWMGEESCDDNADDADEYDLFGDLENFFQGQEETGPKVQERIAKVTERALRGEIDEEEEKNLKLLKKKHKRPENISNMQIPKIEPFMWRNLKRETRATDFVQLKALENYNYVLTPLIKALDLFKSKKDQQKAVEYVADAYKLIGSAVKATNIARMDKIKKELHQDYKTLCEPKKMTATLLMGDNLSEEIKKVKESTKNSPFVPPFLGKRGGTKQKRFFKGASRYSSNNNNNNEYNNRNSGYNNYSHKKNQNKGFNKKKSNFQNKK